MTPTNDVTTHICFHCGGDVECTTVELSNQTEYVCAECMDEFLDETFYCEGCNSFHSFQPATIWDTPYYFIDNCTLLCSECAIEHFTTGQAKIYDIMKINNDHMPIFGSLVVPGEGFKPVTVTVHIDKIQSKLEELQKNEAYEYASVMLCYENNRCNSVVIYLKA